LKFDKLAHYWSLGAGVVIKAENNWCSGHLDNSTADCSVALKFDKLAHYWSSGAGVVIKAENNWCSGLPHV